MPPPVAPIGPGEGPGWARLASALREALPPGEIDGVWVFRTIRADPRELGTAILSRVHGSRRRIYTARYALTIKGRERGAFEWALAEVGSGPVETVEQLLALVPDRGVADEPPAPVAPEGWFPVAEPGPRPADD